MGMTNAGRKKPRYRQLLLELCVAEVVWRESHSITILDDWLASRQEVEVTVGGVVHAQLRCNTDALRFSPHGHKDVN